MDRIEFSAPGKLVLFGEYAVLFGAPAVVAAVDRRAVVTLQPSIDDGWRVFAPGFAPRPSRFDISPPSVVHWQDGESGRGTYGLVESLLCAIEDSGVMDLGAAPAAEMILDTRAFFEGEGANASKLGLGSSSALTVALVTALHAWSGGASLGTSADRIQELVDLHRQVQGGTGSGIDVAASVLGGVVRFRLDRHGSVAEATPLHLPERLRMVFVWTGRTASTGDFLHRLRVRREAAPGVVEPALEVLGAVSKAGVTALAGEDVGGFLDAVEAFWTALDRLGTAIDMPILSDEHRVLRRIAVDCGVRYKPSGAGGGDFGIGFTSGGSTSEGFVRRATEEGFQVLGLDVDRTGVESSG